jgi:hypothetical protein
MVSFLFMAAVFPVCAAGPAVLVHPSGSTVPENLLHVELRFSAPLQTSLRIEHIKLLDGHGLEIPHPFLDVLLPSADAKRVTILLHPGRVKSGVRANVAMGRALQAGSVVTLLVDDPALAQPIRKTWAVTVFDAKAPQPAHWTFTSPRRGSREPIVLRLDAPISSSTESLIAIRGPDGQRVAGVIHLGDGETVWRFVPARPWRGGMHAVVTHQDLEDPAGNRPCGPFEAIAASRVRCDQGTVHPFEPWTTHE